MDEPIWITREDIEAFHSEQLAEHGGLEGYRDENALESALARPQNLFAYGCRDLLQMAASLAYGLARNHPFADGNKRTSLVATEAFLAYNFTALPIVSHLDRYVIWRGLASGYLSEEKLLEIFWQWNITSLPSVSSQVVRDIRMQTGELDPIEAQVLTRFETEEKLRSIRATELVKAVSAHAAKRTDKPHG